MPLQNTKAEFDRLLQLRNEHPEKAADIDAKIRDRFAETHALMVLDMAGFSRFTQRYSIIHFLAALRRLCAIAIPLIEQHQGMMVKQDADNIFAIFPDVNCAIEAAFDINQSLKSVNSGLPDTLDLHVGVGIGYGELLMIEGHDMFGNEMNLASKLGEDLARSGEILVTEAAYKQTNSSQWAWEALEYSVSGLSLVTYKVGKAIAI